MTTTPQFYQCGICDHWHSAKWNDDCRQDDARFTEDQIEAKYGEYGVGWKEVPMPGGCVDMLAWALTEFRAEPCAENAKDVLELVNECRADQAWLSEEEAQDIVTEVSTIA